MDEPENTENINNSISLAADGLKIEHKKVSEWVDSDWIELRRDLVGSFGPDAAQHALTELWQKETIQGEAILLPGHWCRMVAHRYAQSQEKRGSRFVSSDDLSQVNGSEGFVPDRLVDEITPERVMQAKEIVLAAGQEMIDYTDEAGPGSQYGGIRNRIGEMRKLLIEYIDWIRPERQERWEHAKAAPDRQRPFEPTRTGLFDAWSEILGDHAKP